jgi:hypothetical protein
MGKLYKLFVNVPVSHADAVRAALGQAGAGRLGEYHSCSFSVRGIGRFVPGEKASPYIGKAGQPEAVEEEQIQVTVMEEDMQAVLQAARKAHPYEEVGFDVFEQVPFSM